MVKSAFYDNAERDRNSLTRFPKNALLGITLSVLRKTLNVGDLLKTRLLPDKNGLWIKTKMLQVSKTHKNRMTNRRQTTLCRWPNNATLRENVFLNILALVVPPWFYYQHQALMKYFHTPYNQFKMNNRMVMIIQGIV